MMMPLQGGSLAVGSALFEDQMAPLNWGAAVAAQSVQEALLARSTHSATNPNAASDPGF